MKTNYWLVLSLIYSLGSGVGFSAHAPHKSGLAKSASKPSPATPTPTIDPGAARVTQDHVNVRARADVDSEVVAHLKKSDLVTVVEQVTTRKPGPGEPSRWAKIVWPSDVAVWVYGDFLDRSASQVKALKLNLRAGPGENYSVVGTLEKGTPIKKLDSKGDWWKIEAPEGCHAFIAASLLESKPLAEPVAVARATPPPNPTISAPPTRQVPSTTLRPAVPLRPMPPLNTVTLPGGEASKEVAVNPPLVQRLPPPTFSFNPPPVQQSASLPPPQPSLTLPVASAPAIRSATVPPILSREPGEIDLRTIHEEAYVKRIVTREGVVRRTLNVQAPSYLVLENLHNGRVMNYLYSSSTNMNLSSFRGRVVSVTGEEALDERWPNVPVIRVETLHTAP